MSTPFTFILILLLQIVGNSPGFENGQARAVGDTLDRFPLGRWATLYIWFTTIEPTMTSRRALLATVGAAVGGLAGCLGPSGDGDNSTGDDGGDSGPTGEVVVEGPLSDTTTVDRSARLEDGTVDENLIIEGTVTNDAEDRTLVANLALTIEQFRRNETTTLEVGPGESAEFELTLTAVYGPQFSSYTLTVTTEES
jgi:hypothetical protein